MMNEEDGAPSGAYVKGSGLEGLYAAELAKAGIDVNKMRQQGRRPAAGLTPYYDAANGLVNSRALGSVDRAVADLKELIPNPDSQFYSALKTNVSSLIYNKGSGPQFREQIKRQLQVPPSEVGDDAKAAFAIALLGTGEASIVDAGLGGRGSYLTLNAQTTANEKAIGDLGGGDSFKEDVFDASDDIRSFYDNLVNLVNAPFPG